MIFSSFTEAFLVGYDCCLHTNLGAEQALCHQRFREKNVANRCWGSYSFLPLMIELRHYTKHQYLDESFAVLKPHELAYLTG
jgi:hypothetical protein